MHLARGLHFSNVNEGEKVMDDLNRGILRMPNNGGKGEMRKPLVAIENWAVVDSVLAPGFQELRPGKHLMGSVLGHASLRNTKLIYTSRIVNIYGGVVETLNTLYQLGEPSEEYKTWERERNSAAA
jgi:hypothetical protein